MPGGSEPGIYSRVLRITTDWLGSLTAVLISIFLVVVWGATGSIFDYSDTWQLIINTSTTVITFWMVFIIQSTQNRDTEALQAKLDELIAATRGARNEGIGIEQLDAEEIKKWRRDPASEE